MRSKALLGFALIALAVGYIELRLPEPVAAQGRDAVYERLAVTGALKSGSLAVTNAASIGGTATVNGLAVSNDATVSGTATVGVLKFGTALTPTITALLAATGIASAATFLRGDGAWVAVQDVYWDWTKTRVTTTSGTTWSDVGLGFSITTSATNTVILDLDLRYFLGCNLRVTGGSSELESIVMGSMNELTDTSLTTTLVRTFLDIRLVDTPGAGTHAYKAQVRQRNPGATCYVNHIAGLNTFTARVIP